MTNESGVEESRRRWQEEYEAFGAIVTVQVDPCETPIASAEFKLGGSTLCTFELGCTSEKVGIPGLYYDLVLIEAGVVATGKACASGGKIAIDLGVDACGEVIGFGEQCSSTTPGMPDFTDLISQDFETGLCGDGSSGGVFDSRPA